MARPVNTQIFPANLSDSLDIQHTWQYNPLGCVRPAPDFGVPIICETYYEPNASFPANGVAYNVFSGCCPLSPNRTNIWLASSPCRQQYCFTADETLASNFDQCVRDAGKAHPEFTGLLDANFSFFGRCERIDYDSLKKGLQPYPNTSAAPKLGSWVALVVVSLGMAVMTQNGL